MWSDGNVRPKLCLFHTLRTIKKYVTATSHTKAQKEAAIHYAREAEAAIEGAEHANHHNLNMNDVSELFRMPTIQRSVLPAYLH